MTHFPESIVERSLPQTIHIEHKALTNYPLITAIALIILGATALLTGGLLLTDTARIICTSIGGSVMLVAIAMLVGSRTYNASAPERTPMDLKTHQLGPIVTENYGIDSDGNTRSVPVTSEMITRFLSYPSKRDVYGFAEGVTFFYYNCDFKEDKGWGCAWRCMQICASTLGLLPHFHSLLEFKKLPLTSQEWAEPGYAKEFFDFQGYTTSEIKLYRRAEGTRKTPTEMCSPSTVSHFMELRDLMIAHFNEQHTPIMVDDIIYAYTIIGCRILPNNSTILLIADPHKLSAASGLYTVTLNTEGKPSATSGVDNGTNGLSTVQHMRFDKGWILFFPKRNPSS